MLKTWILDRSVTEVKGAAEYNGWDYERQMVSANFKPSTSLGC
jgi:hypothetical protein